MLYEHSYVTNLETTAPQSDLTGAEKKKRPSYSGQRARAKQLFTAQTVEHKVTDRERRKQQKRAWLDKNHTCAFRTTRKDQEHSRRHTHKRRATNFPGKTAATNRSRPQRTTTPHPRTRLARAPDYLDAHREQQLAITMYEPKNAEERRTEVPKQLGVPCTKQRRERA